MPWVGFKTSQTDLRLSGKKVETMKTSKELKKGVAS